MEKNAISVLFPILYSIIGTIISIGVGSLIKGQLSIRKEARDGREKIYNKLEAQTEKHNELGNRVTKLETIINKK